MSKLTSKIGVLILIFIVLDFYGCVEKAPITMVKTNGEEIYFSNTGEGDIALVFIHGFGNNKGIWDEQISHFSDKYKVIALDLPGFGLSSHNRTDWTMENFGKDIEGVIKELELKKVVLIGFSMGVPVAVEAAHLLKDETISLVLVDNIKDLSIQFPDEYIEGTKAFLNDLMTNPSEEKLVQGGFFKQNTKESYQKVLKMIDESTSNEGWDEILTNMFKWMNEKEESKLRELTLPVTIINSDNGPTNLAQLKSTINDLNIEILPNSGHCVFWDFPYKFNTLVEESIP